MINQRIPYGNLYGISSKTHVETGFYIEGSPCAISDIQKCDKY